VSRASSLQSGNPKKVDVCHGLIDRYVDNCEIAGKCRQQTPPIPATQADRFLGLRTHTGQAQMTDTRPAGKAGNRDVRQDYPRLLSITDGIKGRDYPPRLPILSLRLSLLPAAPARQALLAAAPKFRRSSQSVFDEGWIGEAMHRAVRHDRVDPIRPKADAQSVQLPDARHRPRCLSATCGLYRSLAPTNPAR
jgi:hypothetical protein